MIDATSQDCMVMSLVENLARRQHRAIDLLHDIQGLKRRGYDEIDIATKTGLTLEYARGPGRAAGLLDSGEHRLLRAVESGHLPVSVAVEIAEVADTEVQRVLHEAYERKLLRGTKLAAVKRSSLPSDNGVVKVWIKLAADARYPLKGFCARIAMMRKRNARWFKKPM